MYVYIYIYIYTYTYTLHIYLDEVPRLRISESRANSIGSFGSGSKLSEELPGGLYTMLYYEILY